MSAPYFNLYPTDFEADTSHLTLEEDGAYNRLLRLCWMSPGCSVRDDDAWIARRMRVDVDTYARVVEPLIREFFQREKGRVFSPRLLREFKKLDETSRKRSAAGKKGGRPQATENKEKEEKPGFDFDKGGLSYTRAFPEPEPEPDINSGGGSAREREAPPHPDGWNPDQLHSEVMAAVGLNNGRIPTHWMPPGATTHVWRWHTDLGLTPDQIILAARQTRQQHHEPPDGPKALDRAMARYAAALQAPPMQAMGEAQPPPPRFDLKKLMDMQEAKEAAMRSRDAG